MATIDATYEAAAEWLETAPGAKDVELPPKESWRHLHEIRMEIDNRYPGGWEVFVRQYPDNIVDASTWGKKE